MGIDNFYFKELKKTIVFCVAQRKNITPWKWPVQEKYK
jgi:hypothetical protein